MRVAVFGLGYVGFTAACCIASQGHEVVGVDVSRTKVADVNAGRAPFHEPGLADLMAPSVAAGRLRATADPAEAIPRAQMALVCVGTPSGADGAHDMRFVAEVTRQIAAQLARQAAPHDGAPLTLVYRSTMRPGSVRGLIIPILRAHLGPGWEDHARVVYNPEFLREGSAIEDYFHPPKVVVGTADGGGCALLDTLNEEMDAPAFNTFYEVAELTKFVDNSWHAVKVAFANEIGRICERLSIPAADVHRIFVSDTKLNISAHYTRPGGAFGGSCLPKDVRALQHIAADVGAHTHLVDSLLRSNDAHKNHQFECAIRSLGKGARVLMLGLAFKPGTDDLRESPHIDLLRKLANAGHLLRVYDPHVSPTKLVGHNLGFLYAALPRIDALMIDRAEAEAGEWDLVIVANEMQGAPHLPGVPVLRTDVMA
ncbi:GDP-mannose dehydrogenase [Brevirhabdus pacifica]|uniref:UDP-glucose 6-dehydrogenase n=1 Tax=Brevirhabdus pacifica TaxID=1267768 RepID=A0A1U7DG07_9RHOB|nr:nucleotide sugar dehydrogenase [Brevirhabdus pacifica]APX88896.1 GDP-mannose dehydrogenase [Brevirhabdus pacifica]OWU80127.1 GDP-mannose dehydrogenase [Loktanella sp. 22II-4b]PJJ86559.1 GDP-mannose 6-dehydrogenase [Brevirhabdus pacifica]